MFYERPFKAEALLRGEGPRLIKSLSDQLGGNKGHEERVVGWSWSPWPPRHLRILLTPRHQQTSVRLSTYTAGCQVALLHCNFNYAAGGAMRPGRDRQLAGGRAAGPGHGLATTHGIFHSTTPSPSLLRAQVMGDTYPPATRWMRVSRSPITCTSSTSQTAN